MNKTTLQTVSYICNDGMHFKDDYEKESISITCLENNQWSAIDWTLDENICTSGTKTFYNIKY